MAQHQDKALFPVVIIIEEPYGRLVQAAMAQGGRAREHQRFKGLKEKVAEIPVEPALDTPDLRPAFLRERTLQVGAYNFFTVTDEVIDQHVNDIAYPVKERIRYKGQYVDERKRYIVGNGLHGFKVIKNSEAPLSRGF